MKQALVLLILLCPSQVRSNILTNDFSCEPEAKSKGRNVCLTRSEDGLIELRMKNRSWSRVFDWLTDQTGIPVATSFTPGGSFTFEGSEGSKYTISEIHDIINRALGKDGLALIRRKNSFVLAVIEDMLVA